MSVVGAANTIDWVSSAWDNIRAQANTTGIPILDAASGKDKGFTVDISDLATQLCNIQIDLLEGMGTIAGQRALDRIQNDIQNKFSSVDISV